MRVGAAVYDGKVRTIVEFEGCWYDIHVLQSATVSIESLIVSGLLTEVYLSGIVQNSITRKAAILPAPERFALPYRPGKIVALGRNYAAHAKELNNPIPEEPLIFEKSPTACIGDGDTIQVEDWYGRVDHEGELAIVIGKTAKNLTPESARDVVAGYTLLNDVTARDIQSKDKQRGHPWFRSKNMDTFCPIGPVIALPEEVPWPLDVELSVRVNGELRQQGRTTDFLFSIPEMLAYITRFMTLNPGDLVSTGTPEGVGPLADGDRVEVDVPEIGILRSLVQQA